MLFFICTVKCYTYFYHIFCEHGIEDGFLWSQIVGNKIDACRSN